MDLGENWSLPESESEDEAQGSFDVFVTCVTPHHTPAQTRELHLVVSWQLVQLPIEIAVHTTPRALRAELEL